MSEEWLRVGAASLWAFLALVSAFSAGQRAERKDRSGGYPAIGSVIFMMIALVLAAGVIR